MKPADPTTITLDFYSNGVVLIRRRKLDGTGDVVDVYEPPPSGNAFLVATANPGGTGELDERGAHAEGNGGAYFRMELHRVY